MTTFTTDDRIYAEKDGSFTIDCRLKPLTEQEINGIVAKYFGDGFALTHKDGMIELARAVEKTHGIR